MLSHTPAKDPIHLPLRYRYEGSVEQYSACESRYVVGRVVLGT